jgi:hypothetical protein
LTLMFCAPDSDDVQYTPVENLTDL